MCQIIVINRGEKEITTPREFKNHFLIFPVMDENYKSVDIDSCLCQIDIDETFNRYGIPFKKDCGDYYVGQLELVKGDDD